MGVLRNIINNWVLPGLVILLLVSAVQAFFNSRVAISDGEAAPDFSLLNTQGDDVRLSEYAGKRVVINFWGTWCGPCLREMPGLNSSARSHPEVEFLGVAIPGDAPQNPRSLARAKKRLDIPFQVLDADGLVQQAYGVRVLPTTFLIDEQGRVVRHQVGTISESRLASWLR